MWYVCVFFKIFTILIYNFAFVQANYTCIYISLDAFKMQFINIQ